MASQSHVPSQQQQSTEQISVPIVHDGSSIMKISSQNMQVVASEMNSRKRGQSSSQFASSQKAKKKTALESVFLSSSSCFQVRLIAFCDSE